MIFLFTNLCDVSVCHLASNYHKCGRRRSIVRRPVGELYWNEI